MNKWGKRLLSLLVLVAFLAIWKGYVEVSRIPAYLLPPPERVLAGIVKLWHTGDLQKHLGVTFEEIAIGTLIGSVLGVIFGYVLAKSELLERVISPYILIAQTAPKISLAPLFLLWFGLGITSKVVLVALVVFFPITINVMLGIRSIGKDMINLLRILKASRWQRFLWLEVPAALPMAMAGFRISTTQAVVAAIIGELMGAKAGLGFLLTLGSETYDIVMILSSVTVMSFLGLISYWVVAYLEARLLTWHESKT
ncbi:MAG TPA: ABC transporter permease [Firmicutes bacterium]|nr:ABC transporter permease [Bacillota bacterium]